MKTAFCKLATSALFLSVSLLCSSSLIAAERKAADPEQKALAKLAAVTASNATVILPLGQSRDTQLFFTLSNNSSEPLVLTSIKSAQVDKAQWIPVQSQVNAWTIAPHQQLVLDGKKRYIQLQGLKQPISSGDELLFDLGFSDGSSLVLVAKARSAYDQTHGH